VFIRLKNRIKLYRLWYRKLRKNGYMWHNCVEWAIYNSATHNLDGSYK